MLTPPKESRKIAEEANRAGGIPGGAPMNHRYAKIVTVIAASLVALGMTGQSMAAPLRTARASTGEAGSGEVWKLVTPFGILYGRIPREVVSDPGRHAKGTIIIKTGQRRLYYALGDGTAIRYGIGVGREGSAWSGVSTISAKREWPDWTPTPSILKRMPNVPRHMAGGPDNPLGARALYLGTTLYRIHGTNEPWKLGGASSAGCIRMANDDVIDLYERTRIGATVIVQP
jgi:lipoprotein-anchoring transpeptidase ErfK/SrfK